MQDAALIALYDANVLAILARKLEVEWKIDPFDWHTFRIAGGVRLDSADRLPG